jgi:hypothetical protein
MHKSQEGFQHTEMMTRALQFINSTGRHIFLTGKAGTGKTTFLKSLLLQTHKHAVIVAPTGIAALNAGGTTIHSQFLLPFGMFIPDRAYAESPTEGAAWYTESVLAKRHPLNSLRKQVLRSIDLLVIDEVSMLRADLLDAIDYRLRSARGNHTQGFGGVQLLLIGDLYQLPPVVKREETARLSQYYNTPWFFESKALQRDGFAYIELDKIFRQRDEDFIRLLNNLRVNRVTNEDLTFLNSYYKSSEEIQGMREVITLTTHNNKADAMNMKALQELQTPSHFFEAKVEGDFLEGIFPVLHTLELKEGTQIMFTRNDSEEGAYYNGKLATVISIDDDGITVSMADSGSHYVLKKSRWENKKYTVNPQTKELEDEVVGTFEQYPIKLAWAITVHKSQGLTFDRAIIDVGSAFADGQVYVALSRLRSIDGLILNTKVDPSVVSTDRQVISFDQQNNNPGKLDAEIKLQQKEFLIKLGARTFDFDDVVKEVQWIAKSNVMGEPVGGKVAKSTLTQIHDALSAEAVNTAKFRGQLKTLLEEGRQEELLIRIGKGRDYYKALLWDQIKLLAMHLAEMRERKRVKEYVRDLEDVDQLLWKKLEEVDKVHYLMQGILEGKIHFDFSHLTEERLDMRAALMKEISAQHKPVSKKGKRKKNSNEPRTHDVSIEMFERGMTIEDIAKDRGLAVSTIERHLIKGIETGRISIFTFMNERDVETIAEVLKTMPEEFSSVMVFEKLQGRFTYGQLRAVMHHTGIKSTGKKQPDVE